MGDWVDVMGVDVEFVSDTGTVKLLHVLQHSC